LNIVKSGINVEWIGIMTPIRIKLNVGFASFHFSLVNPKPAMEATMMVIPTEEPATKAELRKLLPIFPAVQAVA